MSEDLGDLDDQIVQQRRWQSREDLVRAYHTYRQSKIKADSAKMHLEALIMQQYREGLLTVSEISERSHTSRGMIYRLLHKEGMMTTNTPEDDDYGNAQASTTSDRHREQDQPSRRMA